MPKEMSTQIFLNCQWLSVPITFTIESSVTDSLGRPVTLTYRVNIHRRQSDDVYYNELYRDQYHYSVKDGWANDPNGLVFYKGRYHLFYQFYDDTKWGPMHWAHATSRDFASLG